MPKTTAPAHPPQAMSPAELAACRRHLEQQWATQPIDTALLHRAWETAHQIAAMLYQDFGATRVAVFGSLAEKHWFTPQSDIDIVAWGMPKDNYWDAYGKVVYFDAAFHIDFVSFEKTQGLFRERVRSQAVFIQKPTEPPPRQTAACRLPISAEQGERYEINRRHLLQRINDERAKIERTLGSIAVALEDIKGVVPNHRKYIEESIAIKLTEVYEGVETIFERIARRVDRHVPDSEKWHNELLQQMAACRAERPPVISEETAARLKDLLDFRHKVRNIYSEELIYELTEAHAETIHALFARVCADLDAFAASLEKEEPSE
ncbi:hypothetical protein C6495_02115 [Candidatus Poribacteria bacterium]|nr:MAG: hypothetical protein C6495_02115 [Candidatus Poribacteria bacterium]